MIINHSLLVSGFNPEVLTRIPGKRLGLKKVDERINELTSELFTSEKLNTDLADIAESMRIFKLHEREKEKEEQWLLLAGRVNAALTKRSVQRLKIKPMASWLFYIPYLGRLVQKFFKTVAPLDIKPSPIKQVSRLPEIGTLITQLTAATDLREVESSWRKLKRLLESTKIDKASAILFLSEFEYQKQLKKFISPYRVALEFDEKHHKDRRVLIDLIDNFELLEQDYPDCIPDCVTQACTSIKAELMKLDLDAFVEARVSSQNIFSYVIHVFHPPASLISCHSDLLLKIFGITDHKDIEGEYQWRKKRLFNLPFSYPTSTVNALYLHFKRAQRLEMLWLKFQKNIRPENSEIPSLLQDIKTEKSFWTSIQPFPWTILEISIYPPKAWNEQRFEELQQWLEESPSYIEVE